jgi:Fe-S cluster assembly ATP-binding protein
LKLFEFLRTIYSKKLLSQVTFLQFKAIVKPLMDELQIDHEFLRRDLNVGFSGGERRKIEILQIKLLEPKYIFLDEVDSGLDVDAFRAVAELLKSVDTENNCFVIITHLFTILEYISVNKVFVLEHGSLVNEGGEDLAMKIKKDGFLGS